MSAAVEAASRPAPVPDAPASLRAVAEQRAIEEPLAAAVASSPRAPEATPKASAPASEHTLALSGAAGEDASAFECNICLELAKEPVVTLCGHLYCWPCLYRWMQVQSYCRACPVCKAGVEIDKVVPIYGRGSDVGGKQAQEAVKEQPVPPRPAGQRLAVTQAPQPGSGQQPQQQQQGVLPALFGFQLGPGQGYVEALTPEQQHQAFLSRLLLMLGSFVIMCLLLF